MDTDFDAAASDHDIQDGHSVAGAASPNVSVPSSASTSLVPDAPLGVPGEDESSDSDSASIFDAEAREQKIAEQSESEDETLTTLEPDRLGAHLAAEVSGASTGHESTLP